MTHDQTNPRKLATLLKKLKVKVEPEDATGRDPVAQLVLALLNWETTWRNADQAFNRLMQAMVDVNDLRVSLEPELIEVIGEDYPLVTPRVMRLRESLNQVYLREHDVKMHSIAGKPKKEQRAYLDSLPGTPPYAAAQVMLLSFGGHAMPVDTKLCGLLAREGIVSSNMAADQVEAFLLRHIRADEALEAYLKLQGWADESRLSPDTSGPAPAVPTSRTATVAASKTSTKPPKPARKTSKRTTQKRVKKK